MGEGGETETRDSTLDVFSLECLSDIQVEITEGSAQAHVHVGEGG